MIKPSKFFIREKGPSWWLVTLYLLLLVILTPLSVWMLDDTINNFSTDHQGASMAFALLSPFYILLLLLAVLLTILEAKKASQKNTSLHVAVKITTIFFVVFPILFFMFLSVISNQQDQKFAQELNGTKIYNVQDSPFLSENGNPIGVKITFNLKAEHDRKLIYNFFSLDLKDMHMYGSPLFSPGVPDEETLMKNTEYFVSVAFIPNQIYFGEKGYRPGEIYVDYKDSENPFSGNTHEQKYEVHCLRTGKYGQLTQNELTSYLRENDTTKPIPLTIELNNHKQTGRQTISTSTNPYNIKEFFDSAEKGGLLPSCDKNENDPRLSL